MKYLNETGMNICSYCIEREEDQKLNDEAIKNNACFVHTENYEYIIHISSEKDIQEILLQDFKGDCLEALKEAIETGHTYICFYVD